jgi:hypothetical protein
MSWRSFLQLSDWPLGLLARLRSGEKIVADDWSAWIGDRGEVHVEKKPA